MARILLVEDDEPLREMMSHALKAAGHSVSGSSDGGDALRKLKRKAYDLVLLDIMMPGMSGYEVLEEIRAMPKRADTPVIVVTARHDPGGVGREMAAGAADHIAKPFQMDELFDAIERALAHPTERDERRRMIERDAEVYGTLRDLMREAREEDEQQP